MRTLIAFTLMALLASGSPAKPWYKSTRWWAGEAVIITNYVLDGRSTCVGQGLGLTEQNPILGRHPSCRRVAWFETAAIGSMTAFHIASHWSLEDDKKGWRFAGDVSIPVIVSAIEVPTIIHNRHLNDCARAGLRCN